MTGALRHVDDDAPARCTFCPREAAGPCASCHTPVCGDCSTLTEGGAKVWAICLECDRRGGRSLSRAWMRLVASLVGGLVLLGALLALLEWLWPTPRR